MTQSEPVPDVLVIGGGMITADQILPSLYHLQRLGLVGTIRVCARHNAPLRALAANPVLADAFPGQNFTPFPALDVPADNFVPDAAVKALAALPPRQLVIVATPDQTHFDLVLAALRQRQHLICVKPLVLEYGQAVTIEAAAQQRGLFVGVEYHKRFDRRVLLARKDYAAGAFGEFVMGEARMIEPYRYRHSNFQNWFHCDQTDPFVYVGCHYVDQVCFITGLRPAAVSVSGVERPFPNGREGVLWANGRVVFENGAILSVTDGLGYPDQAAGSNAQGITMYFEGRDRSAVLEHDDCCRGVQHGRLEADADAGAAFKLINPDYFQLVPWTGPGLRPVGYGYESIEANVRAAHRVEAAGPGAEETALARRQCALAEIDAHGLIATPANSFANELVHEAARLSIRHGGRFADIRYEPEPEVRLRS